MTKPLILVSSGGSLAQSWHVALVHGDYRLESARMSQDEAREYAMALAVRLGLQWYFDEVLTFGTGRGEPEKKS